MANKGSDFNNSTVWSLLGLLEPHEFFISADHFACWRRHLAWSKHDGAELRTYMTQRFASSMVFMSLLLSAELGVLFNSSKITTEMRAAMMKQEHTDMKFYIGLLVVLSVFLTLFTLIATFCAWGMVSAISDSNAHCLLRSSIGQYVAQLPSRLLVSSVYCFIIWMTLWLFELLPGMGSKILFATMGTLFVHIITSFSAFGRLMMLSGAMGSERILDEEFEQALLPSGLHAALLLKASDRKKKRLTVTAQYSTRKLPVQSTSSNNGVAKAVSSPHHKRDDTMGSDLENYLIEKTANAFSKRSVHVDTDVMATAPLIPSIVSPGDDTDAKEDDSFSAANEKRDHLRGGDMTDRADKAVSRGERDSVVSAVSDATASSFDKEYFTGTTMSPPLPRYPLRRTTAKRRFGRFNKSTLQREWDNDEEARSMYNRPPAAKIEDDAEAILPSTQVLGGQGSSRRLPRASVLNTANHSWNSISRLTIGLSGDEDGGEDVRSSTGGLLTNVAQKGMEPFVHFISRLNGKEAGDESCVRASLVMMGEEAANAGENLECGERDIERVHLLGDKSTRRTAYTGTSQDKQMGQSYPLSPIESIGDLEELHGRESPRRSGGLP